MSRLKFIPLLIIIFLVSFRGNATLLPHNTVVITGSTTWGSTAITPPGWSLSYTDLNRKGVITLGIDQHYPLFVNQSVTEVTVYLEKYASYSSGTPTSTETKVLKVSYYPIDSATYVDKNTVTFDNVEKVNMTITQIKVNGVVQSTLPGNVYLQGDVFVDRVYDFLPQVNFSAYNLSVGTPVDLDCDNTDDELVISWNAVPGAEEYQLEWTFINTIDVTAGNIPNLQVDFHTNSTRITTTDLSYKVSLLFDKGVLAFRVRAVGRSYTDPSKFLFSSWSSSDGLIALSTIPAAAKYQVTVPYDVKKNWQHSTTYAEEGKKKEVVSFYDGSLRNRQMVTKINTDHNTIVGESIYDHQGRPVIQVLPVPVASPDCPSEDAENSLKYYKSFNKNNSDAAYSKSDFDVTNPADSCNMSLTGGMNTNSGASNYYSSSNPNTAGSQAYIPNAEQYPFSQVEYMPDNTGRIRRQGGVGQDFQLGSNHETKYFYAHPFQEQLDRLFGSEVGDAAHYQKNMVIDPNGQVSVSYLDQEGRVVATSLAGQAPNNLSALPSADEIAPLSVDLFAKDAQGNSSSNKLNSDGVSKVFNQTISLSSVSDVTIAYDIAVGPYTNPCLGSLCFNCVYDLQIEVRDLCGQLVSPIELSNKLSGRFTVGADDQVTFQTDCGNYSSSSSFIMEDLPVGTYQITKRLTVNQAALDAYMAMYTDPESGVNTCIEDYQTILEQVGENSNISDCEDDFSCAECAANLGSLLQYIQAGGTEEQYNEELAACNAPCKAASYYENMRNMLLMDMRPNGQYGEYLNNLNQIDETLYPLSVLNQGNSLPKSPNAHWRNPRYDVESAIQNYYFDSDGVTRSRITLDNVTIVSNVITASTPAVQSSLTLGSQVFLDPVTGNYYTYPQYLANLSDFVNYYSANPYWANSLVYYHPEYPMLMTYKSFYVKVNNTDPYTSESFDQKMMSVNTWADAVTAGFINPNYASVAVNSRLNNILTINGSYPWDPFSNYVNTSGMNAKVFNYTTINSVSYSMMQVAAMMNRGGNNLIGTTPSPTDLEWGKDVVGYTSTQNTQLRDDEWMTFRGLYLAAKQGLQHDLAQADALGTINPGYNGCIGNQSFNPFENNFLQITPFSSPFIAGGYINPAQPCAAYTYSLYKYKQVRFGNTLANVNTDPSQIAYQQYILTGQCPIATTFERILSEAASTGVLDDNNFTIALNSLSGLILSMQDFETPVSIPTLTWYQSSMSGSTLQVEWQEGSSYFGEFTLVQDPGSMAYSWSDIIGFGNLHFTHVSGGLYEFTVTAQVSISGVLYTQTLTGSTSFKIGNCTFPDVCKLNDFGKALESITNTLAQMGTLSSTTNVSLMATPYVTFVNNAVKYTINPAYTSGTINWKYNSAIPGFQLTDGSSTVQIKILNQTPSAFSIASIGSIAEIIPCHNNTLKFVCNNASGAYLGELYCDLIRSDDKIMTVGDCGLDNAILCTGVEYDTYDDLMAVLEFSLVNQDAPFSLYNTPLWTSTLNSQLPATPTSIPGIVSGDKLTYDLPGSCDLLLSYSGSSPNFNYNNILSVDDVRLLESNYYGSYNTFRLYITYAYGGATYQDSIDGSSCFNLKVCSGCTQTPNEDEIGPASAEQTDGEIDFDALNDEFPTTITNNSELYCLDMYEDYQSAYNLAITHLKAIGCINPEATLSMISYEEFVASNLCCASGFMDLSSLIGQFIAILGTDDCSSTVYIPTPDCGAFNSSNVPLCTKVYSEYTRVVGYFNNWAPWPKANDISLSVATQTSYSCECFANYITYLFEYITAAPTENLTHPLSIGDYCAQMTSGEQSNCTSSYDLYVLAIKQFNKLKGPGAPLPTIDYDVFVENGLCNCVDEYVSELNLAVNGYNSGDMTDLYQFCLSGQEVPCVIDTPTVHFETFDVTLTDPCTEFYQSNNEVNAQIAYNEQVQLLQTQLGTEYIAHCMKAVENLSLTYNEIEHHFTLYYYDQAGNLVKTVPPEGVELIDISNTTTKNAIKADRQNNTHQVITNHRMATTYLYNSLNQLVAQNMPDQDAMEVFDLTLPNGLPIALSTTAIQMLDANQGYLSGYMNVTGVPMLSRGYLFKTTNGGLNWVRVTNTLGSELKEVKMASATVGYAIGTGGIILITADGGQNWDLVNTTFSAEFSAIEVVGTDAYVLERVSGRIQKITSAGVMTLYAAPPTGTYSVVEWKDFTLQGNVSSLTGILYLVTLTESSVNYDAVVITNSSSGYVVDKTLVGNLGAISFINGTDGIIAGDDGNLSYLNGATSTAYRQQLKLSGTAGLIDQIYMLDASVGIARITENGVKVIRKTTDGGLTWGPLQQTYTNATLSLIRRTATTLEVMLTGNTGAPLNTCYTKNILISSGGTFGEIDQTPSLAQTYQFNVTATYNDGTNLTYFAIGLSGGDYKLFRSNTFTGMSADVTYTQIASFGATMPKEMVVVKSGTGVAVEVLAVSGVIYRSKSVSTIGGTYDPFAAVTGTNTNFVSMDKITISSLDYVLAYRSSDKQIYGKAGTSSGPFYFYSSTLNPGTSTITKLAVHGSNVTIAGTNGGIFTTSTISAIPTSSGALSLTFTDRTQHRLTGITSLRKTASMILITGQNGQVFTRPVSATTNTVSLRPIGSVSNISTANEYVSSSVPYYLIAGADGLLATLKSTTWSLDATLYTTTGLSVSEHSAANDINDIAVNGLSVFLVGENGSSYYTANITTDFFTPGSNPSNKTLYGVDFITGSTVKATAVGSGSEVIRFNSNFGTRINRVFGPKLNDVHFENGQFGTIIGDYYFIRSTIDGGLNWRMHAAPTIVGTTGLTKVWTKSGSGGQHFALIGGVNSFLKLDNGTISYSALTGTVNDIQFSKSNPLFGYVAYTNSLAKINLTASGGTYSYVLSTASYTGTSAIRAIHVFENKSAIMVGDAGKIHYFRFDTGTNYALATVSGATFRDVYFLDNKIGLAVGNAGIVYRLNSPNNDNVTHDILSSGFTATNQSFTDPLAISAALYNINAIAFSSQNTAIYGGNFLTDANANANQAMVRNLKFESGLYTMRFFYDRLGRIVASQNSRQFGTASKSDDKYSYTLYDALGRVYEAGEKSENASGVQFASIFGTNVGGITVPNVIDDTKRDNWLNLNAATTRKEVTKIHYDKTNTVISTEVTSLTSLNTATQRKRIVHMTYSAVYSANANEYDHATHYDYDIHGNVKTLYQDNRLIKDMAGIGDHRLKRLDYIYDLISGNVNRVDYQTGNADQWHHTYNYDADNRITDVYTTTETPLTGTNSSIASIQNEPELNTMWERDTRYEYYAHGPLARIVLGDHEVQGVDYVYTLQGWIKSVNSNTLDPNRDPGMDGAGLSNNHAVAQDVYGYSLHHFDGDYPGAIGGNNTFVAAQTGSDVLSYSRDLYNGNIGRMITVITKPDDRTILPLGNAYRYDQLNRLTESYSFDNINFGTNSWESGSSHDKMYRNLFSYDANGNILTQSRIDENEDDIDNLTYHYPANSFGKTRNRLLYVDDNVNSTYYTDDIDDQSAGNYTYDAEGRLVGDVQEQIASITWRVDGKVKKITRNSGSGKENTSFDYDAMGRRIAKHVYTDADLLKNSTYYILDGAGNVMSVYEREINVSGSSVTYAQTEKHLYGSARLGMHTERIPLLGTQNDVYSMGTIQHHIGDKRYELSNHLGNVLTVISDKIVPEEVPGAGTVTAFDDQFTASGNLLGWEPDDDAIVSSDPLSAGFTLTASGGTLNMNCGTSSSLNGKMYKAYNFIAGATYTLTFNYTSSTSSSAMIGAFSASSNMTIALVNSGSNTVTFTGNGESGYIGFIVQAQGLATFDNIKLTYVDPGSTIYLADIRQSTDYSPFGVILKGRDFKPAPQTETIPAPQVIYSSNFESSTVVVSGTTTTVDGWYNFSGSTLSLDNTSTQRVKVVSTNATHGANQFFAVTPGANHTFSVKIDKGTTSTVNIVIFYNCPSMTSNSGSPTTIVAASSNGTYTANFTSTTGYVFIQIRQSGTYYFDDVSITNNDAVTTITRTLVHRYGFQGQEMDDEVKGSGNSYNYEHRLYDPRLGRWFSRDLLADYYPNISTYAFCANNPNSITDIDGRVLRDKNGNILYTKVPNSKPFQTKWPTNSDIAVTVQEVYIYNDCGEKTKVQLITAAKDTKTGKSIDVSAYGQFYNCHGQSSLDKQFIVDSDKEVSNNIILDKQGKSHGKNMKSGLKSDFSKIKKGDIIVYYDKNGVAIHSAVWTGKNASEDKVESKNGYENLATYKEGDVYNTYKKLGAVGHGFFTPEPDDKVDIQGTVNSKRKLREVTEADVKAAIRKKNGTTN
ncbi:RHS repeat-associated core domain-containing protein [Fluviicola sp.]|uniref:RHS repeat-associated core domain-containing protein n=1 Tax=Fluviicola sp. TaxID=1917219 RepID=UPI0031D10006